ncbi:hypothetical protein H6G36_03095 [Anabaena minutissima FACHB-250]|nr:hypothetical protein [Anabaena minutissima FACHB-250]
MGGFFNFNHLIGKTIEEAENLIKGMNYKLRIESSQNVFTDDVGIRIIYVVVDNGIIIKAEER